MSKTRACQWFVFCGRLTSKSVEHPRLSGPVPCCESCAKIIGRVAR